MTGREARDERDALIEEVEAGDFMDRAWMIDIIDRLVEYIQKHPEPEITDETALRFLNALYRRGEPSNPEDWGEDIAKTRAALEATLRVPVGEGEQ